MLNYLLPMAILAISKKFRQVAAGYAELNDKKRHEFVALVAPSDGEEVKQGMV